MTQIAPNLDDVFALSERLDARDRVTLARWLLESVAAEEAQVDQDLETAWNKEMDRRIAAIDSGEAELLDWDDAMALIFEDPEGEIAVISVIHTSRDPEYRRHIR